jgi:RNA polymerase sigma factor (sigma-70 family)
MPEPAPQSSTDAVDLTAWTGRRDEEAFARLVQRHAALVTGICRRRLGAWQADEAAQAVFIVLARRAGQIDGGDRLGAWLHGVAIRVCSEARRTAVRRSRHERQDTGIDHPAPDGGSSWDELRPHLDDAIAALSAAQREVVVGHFLEGLTQSAVAQRLGISEDAAHQRLHYAVSKLRTWFGRRGMAVSLVVLAGGLATECHGVEPMAIETCVRVALQPATSPIAAALAQSLQTAALPQAVAVAAGLLLVLVSAGAIALAYRGPPAGQLLHEDFERAGGLGPGWYDNDRVTTSAAVQTPGGDRAAEFRFAAGASVPLSGGPSRHLFQPSDAIRISYLVKYAPEWSLAGPGDLLLQCLIMTDVDDRLQAPSNSHLTCVIGMSGAIPFVSLQDAQNIDASRIGEDLSEITELRAVAGGNTTQIVGAESGYYRRADRSFGNVTRFLALDAAFTDQPGPNWKGDWHHIEVRLRLNGIASGRAVADGRIACLIDGRMVLDRSDVLFRTARHPAMRFNQLIIGPWMEAAPSEQAFWIDDLTVTIDPVPTAP